VLNEAGGILDDVIVYCLAQDRYRMVANAATREKDLMWMKLQAGAYQIAVVARNDLAMVVVQGLRARALFVSLFDADTATLLAGLARFKVAELDKWYVARTGYIGKDNFEIMLPRSSAPAFWRRLIAVGVAPVGLGARDTLRLEAGLNLYDANINDKVSPLECGLAWTVNLTGD
jgi:aminomethyltransferase